MIEKKENKIKFHLKKIVIRKSSLIWGNGKVSNRYFVEKFNFPSNKIINQYLTVDGSLIQSNRENKSLIRKSLREKYNIDESAKVFHYSGRIVDIKNLEITVRAISSLSRDDIVLLITGDGIRRKNIEDLCRLEGVKTVITGFISNQEELFRHYYMSDVFILPSIKEPWGLVVNEAMFAGLPVIISKECGCSLDLVSEGENGYIFDPYDIDSISKKMEMILMNRNIKNMGYRSEEIIKDWSFTNSSKSFDKLVNILYKQKLENLNEV